LPNREVDQNGTARMDFVATGLSLAATSERTLMTGNGTALVIHETQDDQLTDPSGNSGARIACGVIRASEQSR
jgi:Cu-Zn family superoxide dismutase